MRSASTTSRPAGRSSKSAGVEFNGETFDSGVCNGAGFKDPFGNPLLLHHRYAPLEALGAPGG